MSVKRTDIAEYGADGLRLLPSTSRSRERLSLDDARDRGVLRTRIAQRVRRLFPPPATAPRSTPTAVDRGPAYERWAAERRRRAEERAAAEREDARPVSEVVDAALRRHAAAKGQQGDDDARPPTAAEWKAALTARKLEATEANGVVTVAGIGVVPVPAARGDMPAAVKALIAAETSKVADELEANIRVAIETADPRVTVRRRKGRLQLRAASRPVASLSRFDLGIRGGPSVHGDLIADPSVLSALGALVRDGAGRDCRMPTTSVPFSSAAPTTAQPAGAVRAVQPGEGDARARVSVAVAAIGATGAR